MAGKKDSVNNSPWSLYFMIKNNKFLMKFIPGKSNKENVKVLHDEIKKQLKKYQYDSFTICYFDTCCKDYVVIPDDYQIKNKEMFKVNLEFDEQLPAAFNREGRTSDDRFHATKVSVNTHKGEKVNTVAKEAPRDNVLKNKSSDLSNSGKHNKETRKKVCTSSQQSSHRTSNKIIDISSNSEDESISPPSSFGCSDVDTDDTFKEPVKKKPKIKHADKLQPATKQAKMLKNSADITVPELPKPFLLTIAAGDVINDHNLRASVLAYLINGLKANVGEDFGCGTDHTAYLSKVFDCYPELSVKHNRAPTYKHLSGKLSRLKSYERGKKEEKPKTEKKVVPKSRKIPIILAPYKEDPRCPCNQCWCQKVKAHVEGVANHNRGLMTDMVKIEAGKRYEDMVPDSDEETSLLCKSYEYNLSLNSLFDSSKDDDPMDVDATQDDESFDVDDIMERSEALSSVQKTMKETEFEIRRKEAELHELRRAQEQTQAEALQICGKLSPLKNVTDDNGVRTPKTPKSNTVGLRSGDRGSKSSVAPRTEETKSPEATIATNLRKKSSNKSDSKPSCSKDVASSSKKDPPKALTNLLNRLGANKTVPIVRSSPDRDEHKKSRTKTIGASKNDKCNAAGRSINNSKSKSQQQISTTSKNGNRPGSGSVRRKKAGSSSKSESTSTSTPVTNKTNRSKPNKVLSSPSASLISKSPSLQSLEHSDTEEMPINENIAKWLEKSDIIHSDDDENPLVVDEGENEDDPMEEIPNVVANKEIKKKSTPFRDTKPDEVTFWEYFLSLDIDGKRALISEYDNFSTAYCDLTELFTYEHICYYFKLLYPGLLDEDSAAIIHHEICQKYLRMNKFGFTAKDVIGTGMEIEQYIVYASHLAARSGRKGTRKKFTLLKFIETKDKIKLLGETTVENYPAIVIYVNAEFRILGAYLYTGKVTIVIPAKELEPLNILLFVLKVYYLFDVIYEPAYEVLCTLLELTIGQMDPENLSCKPNTPFIKYANSLYSKTSSYTSVTKAALTKNQSTKN